MSNENKQYDIASISRSSTEKRAHYIQDAGQVGKPNKTAGQFVKVFADIFLRHEASPASYV
jgi:hypothetical protein